MSDEAKTIPLCVPEIRGNEWSYVKDCFDTNWVSSAGAYVDRFQSDFAERVGADHAVAMVNGTAALHVALRCAGVGAGDEVLVSTLTFVAPANAVRYLNAHPVFVDAEADHWQMDPAIVAEFLEQQCEQRDGELINRASGRPVRAIVPVHILGHPVDLEPILALAERFDLAVIEDASESLGACYKGRSVGSWGEAGCFSFNGNKLITTGGGGMLVSNDAQFCEHAQYLSTQAKDDPLEYVHETIGYNYRLTNVQAAMGCAQLEQLDAYVAAKRAISARYREAFSTIDGIEPMREASWASSAEWLFTVRVDAARTGFDRRELFEFLGAKKIQSRPLWQPMHMSPAHAGSQALGGEVAERLQDECLSLPCSVGLDVEDQERVIDAIRRAVARAGELETTP
jgi:perosamine synthetase